MHMTDLNGDVMEQEQSRKFKLRKILKAACQATGTFLYVFIMMEPMIVYSIGRKFGMNISAFSQFPLTILSAILLARFVKAELVPREISVNRGAS